MRIRLLRKTQPDGPRCTSEPDPDGSATPTTSRLSQRDFLKLAGAALGVGLAAPLVIPPTPALATPLGDTEIDGTLTVTGQISANSVGPAVVFPGADNAASLHWNLSTGTAEIGLSGGVLQLDGATSFTAPIYANGNFGVVFPGTDNWDSLHWDDNRNTLRIGISGHALRIEGPTNFTSPITVNGTTAIDSNGVATVAHQAYYA